MFLEAHFGEVTKPASSVPDGSEDDLLVMRVTVDGVVATVDLISMVGINRWNMLTWTRKWSASRKN